MSDIYEELVSLVVDYRIEWRQPAGRQDAREFLLRSTADCVMARGEHGPYAAIPVSEPRLLKTTLTDAIAENARLTALVESLRREVRTQRLEIAGLREERRALLEADRPQPDRLAAIPTDDPPKPALSNSDSFSHAGKSVETGNVPPVWLQRPYWVDPPSGWAYGFPRLYDPAKDGDITEWMIRNGYPEKLARQGLPCTFTAAE